MSFNAIWAVLSEAKVKFGHPKDWNRPQVMEWVKRRHRGLMHGDEMPIEEAKPVPLIKADYDDSPDEIDRWQEFERL